VPVRRRIAQAPEVVHTGFELPRNWRASRLRGCPLLRGEGPRTARARPGVRLTDAPYSVPGTGQYAQITGRGRIVRIGGHAQAWNAGLVGFVTRPGAAKQRVVITLKGRPKGVFVLTPLQPGVLKRDSGTQRKTAAFG
jgi:hypothetical protein